MEKLLIAPETITHNLPSNLVKEDESDFLNYTSYPTCAVHLKEYRNVRVSPDSVIYKNGRLIGETIPNTQQVRYYRFRHLAKKYLTGKSVSLGREKHLLVTDTYSSGHFHWFCEVLPKLVTIKDISSDFVLLLPDTGYVRSIGCESLRLMQFEFADIRFMKQADFYKVKTLYSIPAVSRGGLNSHLIKAVRQQLTGNKESGGKRIYISRQKAAYRKVLNESEITSLLRQHGFDILVGEDFTLAEQLAMFSSCNTLLGIHGAGLTNCVFMPSGNKVVELRKKENGLTNVGYWHLADSLDHRYYYYNGLPDSELPLVGRGCNLTIPPADFEEKVLAVI